MKANEVLNAFGEEFITEVRNRTMENIQMTIEGKMKSGEDRLFSKSLKALMIQQCLL